MSARIMLTGGGGFVGGHLLRALEREWPEALILADRFDITDASCTEAAVKTSQPDICIHLAAVAAVPDAQSDPGRAWQVNLHGTLHLADALLRHAPGSTLVFASTADAYGRTFSHGRPVCENDILSPVNVYGATKASADLALGAMDRARLRTIRVRAFNHTGPGQSADFVVSSFARQVALIAEGMQPPVIEVGNLDAQRDFLDVRDVCRAYVLCARKAGSIEAGTILNVASGTPRRIGDVLEDLLRLARLDVTVRQDARRMRASDIARATGDSSLARSLLDWQPAKAWETTLSDTLAWWRRQVRLDNQ